jgi:hypothetical protein
LRKIWTRRLLGFAATTPVVVKSIGNIPACPAETLHSAVKEAGTDDH